LKDSLALTAVLSLELAQTLRHDLISERFDARFAAVSLAEIFAIGLTILLGNESLSTVMELLTRNPPPASGCVARYFSVSFRSALAFAEYYRCAVYASTRASGSARHSAAT